MNNVDNALIDKLLSALLDGDQGSNLLGAVLVGLLGAKVDWAAAYNGLCTASPEGVREHIKIGGIVAVAVFSWFVGKGRATNKGDIKE